MIKKELSPQLQKARREAICQTLGAAACSSVNSAIVSKVEPLFTGITMRIIKLIPGPFLRGWFTTKKVFGMRERERLCGVLMSLFKSLTDLQGILYHSSESGVLRIG